MRLVIAANTVSQLIGKIIGSGTTFFITLFLARQFGVEGYGDFIKVTTYISFFFLLADFGLNALYLNRHQEPHAFPTLMGTRLSLSAVLIFIAVALLSFLPQGTDNGYTAGVRLGIILFSPAIIFQALITTANAVFQKRLRYDLATIALAMGSAISLGTLFLLLQISSTATLPGIFSLMAGTVITAACALWGVKYLKESSPPSFSWTKNLAFLVAGAPLGLTLLFNLIYGHIDSVILTLTRSTAEVGIYGLAYKVFEVVLVFPTFFMNAVYPVLLTAKTHPARFMTIIRQSFGLLLALSFLATIAMWVAAPFVSNVQADFSQSITPLRILSLSFPFFFLSALSMWILITLNKKWTLVGIYGGGMLINILLNIMFTSRFGYLAACWITVASEALVLIGSGIVLAKLRKTFPTEKL